MIDKANSYTVKVPLWDISDSTAELLYGFLGQLNDQTDWTFVDRLGDTTVYFTHSADAVAFRLLV